MNKPFLFTLFTLFLLVLFSPIKLNQELNILGMIHHFWIGKDSFLIAFAAMFGLIQGFRIAPVIAILIGSFLSGPIVTGIVAALFVYERSQTEKTWWFSLKDYFSLMLIVFASGLPDPYRSIVTYIGIVGVALDFKIGLFGLMPAVLFSRTAFELDISGEVLMVCASVFVLLHLLWVFGNGNERAPDGWKNGLSLAIITFSLITKEQIFLPTIVILVLADTMMDIISDQNKKRKVILLIVAVLVCIGFPIFTTQAPFYLLAEKDLLWAIPIFPFIISYFGAARISSGLDNKETSLIPWWSGIILFLISTNAFWWSSTFVPGSGLLDWGIENSLMNYLFDKQTEKLGSIDQNSFLIIQALIIFGTVLGYVLSRFYTPEEKIVTVENWLIKTSEGLNKKIILTGNVIPQKLNWVSSRFSIAKPLVDDVLHGITICICLFAILWVVFSIIRRGGVV